MGDVSALRLDVVTVFPRYLDPLRESLLGKATERGLIRLAVHDLRAWTTDVHRTVDDSPYGGGPGMVMRPEPWAAALRDLTDAGLEGEGSGAAAPTLVIPSPSGRRFDQALAADWARRRWLVFACGRYEGLDARVALWAQRRMSVEEVSIGDYVLAGGEAAALVMIETVARLLPGFMGNEASVREDSFHAGMTGLLDWPSYTRPEVWQDMPVPDVLTSGDHARIARWRRDQALARTARRRPDLLTEDVLAQCDGEDLRTLRAAGFSLPPDLLAH